MRARRGRWCCAALLGLGCGSPAPVVLVTLSEPLPPTGAVLVSALLDGVPQGEPVTLAAKPERQFALQLGKGAPGRLQINVRVVAGGSQGCASALGQVEITPAEAALTEVALPLWRLTRVPGAWTHSFRAAWGPSPKALWLSSAESKPPAADAVFRLQDGQLTKVVAGSFYALWGQGQTLWAAGAASGPELVRIEGQTATRQGLPGGNLDGFLLTSLWGFSADEVVAAGYGPGGVGLVVRGGAAQRLDSTNLFGLGLWGATPDELWSVGAGGAYRGLAAQPFAPVAPERQKSDLSRVWGTSGEDFWISADKGKLYYGRALTEVNLGVTTDLRGLGGASARDAWLVGRGGTALHYDGQRWSCVSHDGGAPHLRGVAAFPPQTPGGLGGAVLVGDEGTVLQLVPL